MLESKVTYQGLENLNLSKEPVPVFDFGPRDRLDGPLLSGLSVFRGAHLSIGSLS